MAESTNPVGDLINEAVEKKMAEVTKKYNIGGSVEPEKKSAPIWKMAEKPVEPSISATRYIKLLAAAGGDDSKVGDACKKMYPNDDFLNYAVEQKAASATILTEGGSLVPEILATEMIQLLYNELSVMNLGARRIPMPNGNMTIPRMDTGASVGYIGENTNLGKTQQVFGDVRLSAKKLGAIIPVSNDLIRSSSLAADTYIRDDLVRQMRIKMDYVTLYGSGSSNEPAGLTNLITASTQKVGSSTTAFTSDIPVDMLGKLYQANVPMVNPGWIINGSTYAYLLNLKTSTGAYIYREEMLQAKTLIGIKYVVSNQSSFTAGSPGYVDLWVGDFSEFVIGEQMAMQVEASREAAYYDGANTVSAFQRDQTVIRAISVHDFNIRHPVSFVQGTYKLATT